MEILFLFLLFMHTHTHSACVCARVCDGIDRQVEEGLSD